MRATAILLLFSLFLSTAVFSQVQIYSSVKISNQGPGIYESYKCGNGTDTYFWTDSIYQSYQWSNGSTTDSTSESFSFSTDTLKLVVQLQGGGFDSAFIYIHPISATSFRDMYASGNGLCPGPSEFANSWTNQDSILVWNSGVLYTWFDGNGCYIAGFDVPNNYNSMSTQIGFIKTDIFGCAWTSAMSSMVWGLDTTVGPTVTNVGGTLQASYPNYVSYSFYNAPDYSWYDSGMSLVGTGSTFTPSQSGTYRVKFTVDKYDMYVCAFGGGGTFHGSCETRLSDPFIYTGLEEEHSDQWITIYPNPVSGGKISVQSVYDIENVVVYDLTGKKLLESGYQMVDISLEGIRPGYYILGVTTENSVLYKHFMITD